MTKSVPQTNSARNQQIDYTDAQLRLMALVSRALRGGPAPVLSLDQWEEAEQLLETLPEPEDDGPHEPLCPCWRCDDELVMSEPDEDDAFDMARDIEQDPGDHRWMD